MKHYRFKMNDTYDDEMLEVEEAYGKYKFYKFKF